MKKRLVILATMIMAVAAGSGIYMSKSKVSANERQSTVVGNLDIVKLYMNDYYNENENRVVEGREERTIRIWTPKTYNPADTSKRYAVLYMHDGQNCFDDATSYVGEWGIDETITEFMEQKGYEGTIVVGIDCSNYREPEMKPNWENEDSLADRYSDFIVNTVKPYVDSNYNTYTDRAHTGVGGSSMGGLISFYMGMKYAEVFDYELCFAPAFLFTSPEQVARYMHRHNVAGRNNPRIYMFCGGQDLDAQLLPDVEPMKECIINNGYNRDNVIVNIDTSKGHNESAWRIYFKPAYAWLLGL